MTMAEPTNATRRAFHCSKHAYAPYGSLRSRDGVALDVTRPAQTQQSCRRRAGLASASSGAQTNPGDQTTDCTYDSDHDLTGVTYASGDPVNGSDPLGLCNDPGSKVQLVPGPCEWASKSWDNWAEGTIATQGAFSGSFDFDSAGKAVADYGAGIANAAVSTATFGQVHISDPYCGYSWASNVGGIYFYTAVGILGGGGADAVDAADGSLTLSTEESWGNPATLARHFADHGADFGATSEDEYAAQASHFVKRSQVDALPTRIGSDGAIRTYDPTTNEFGSFNSDGTTRTYFAPDPASHGFPTNWDYWLNQPGSEPWTP
jgi:hypothetical protein